MGIASSELGQQYERLRYMRAALVRTPSADPTLFGRMDAVQGQFDAIRLLLQGDRVAGSLNESSVPSIGARVGNVAGGHWSTRQNPTATQRRNVEIAEADLGAVEMELNAIINGELMAIEEALAAAGAPWTPGRRIGGGAR